MVKLIISYQNIKGKYNLTENIIIQHSELIPQDQSLVQVKQGFFAKFINRIKEIFRLK